MVIGTQQKNRRHLPRCLLQKIIHSDFLRRHYPHQVKGSKFGYFLSACFTSSPVFDCDCILHPLRTNCKRGQRRAQRCKTFFTQVLGRFTQVLLKKKVKYGIFKVDAYPPPVNKKGGIPYEADDPDPKAAFGPRGAVHGAERVRTGTGGRTGNRKRGDDHAYKRRDNNGP